MRKPIFGEKYECCPASYLQLNNALMINASPPKITVALICGGQSPEHEISLLSAKNIFQAIDTQKFNIEIIYIDKKGCFRHAAHIPVLPADAEAAEKLPVLLLSPGQGKHSFIFKDNPEKPLNIDVIFSILHGQLGEDGAAQGLFNLCNIPYVGSGVLGSAINMDKDVTKRLLKEAGIDIAKFLVFHRHEKNLLDFSVIADQLGQPFFIKPTNAGSSIGVYKVIDEQGFELAIADAFRLNEKIIIEEYISGREIECAVLGNEEPQVSLPGEIILHHDSFYTYETKYISVNGASVVVPAQLEPDEIYRFQQIALQSFKILCSTGFARVDFFYTADGRILVNEINTLPGFTAISMYPKCWAASGMTYTELVENLVMLGIQQQRIFG